MNDEEFATSLMQAQRPQPRGLPLTIWQKIKRETRIRFRGGLEQGGYVHDTAMSQFMTPGCALHTIGTWTDTVGNVAQTYMKRRTGAAATNQLVYPVMVPQNSVGLKGAYLKSVDIWWELATAALTSLTPVINLATLPPGAAATGTPFSAVVAVPFSYDAFHNTAPLRLAIGKHHMTLTITTPWWLGPNDLVYVDTAIVDPGTAVYDDYGLRANFTLRI